MGRFFSFTLILSLFGSSFFFSSFTYNKYQSQINMEGKPTQRKCFRITSEKASNAHVHARTVKPVSITHFGKHFIYRKSMSTIIMLQTFSFSFTLGALSFFENLKLGLLCFFNLDCGLTTTNCILNGNN